MDIKYKIMALAAAGCLVFLPIIPLRKNSPIQNQTLQSSVQSLDPAPIADQPAAASFNSGSTPAVESVRPVSGPVPALAVSRAEPVSLKIASIGLSAPLVRTGLESDGSLHVPSNPQQAGWYTGGPMPGEVGPAVITGHYDSAAGPGVFYTLKSVNIGDTIRVAKSDGTELLFRVDRKELYLQDDFPTSQVYGAIPNAGLRVITCAGTYDRVSKHYSHDLVVYASLIGSESARAYQAK